MLSGLYEIYSEDARKQLRFGYRGLYMYTYIYMNLHFPVPFICDNTKDFVTYTPFHQWLFEYLIIRVQLLKIVLK